MGLFIVPIVISAVLYVITKKMEWRDDILTTGLVVCWATSILLFLYDMMGEALGWWTYIVY